MRSQVDLTLARLDTACLLVVVLQQLRRGEDHRDLGIHRPLDRFETATASLGNGALEPTAQDDLTRAGPHSRQDHVEGLLEHEGASLEGMLIRLEESLYLQ